MYQEVPNPADCDRKLASALAVFEEPDSITVPPGALSLEFLQAIYRSSTQPMARRLKAASIAIAYESPKLAVTAVLTDGDDAARAIERARMRSAKVIELRAAQAPINLAPSAAEVSAAASRQPLVSYRRR
jgi:hypothetical protein